MANPGDRVKVKTDKETIEGILMPEPELLDTNAIILKLDTGYNIGIDKKKVKDIKVMKKYEPPKEKMHKHKPNPKLPNVTFMSTGGTISSKVDYRTGGVYADYTAEDFIEMCPEILNIANIKAKKVMNIMSEDFNPPVWRDIAKHAVKELNSDINGLIITQGTDTMHFTTAALSFMLKDLNKPVILTAAQRSIDRGSTDAFMNIICATAAAANFDAAEVMTCMHENSSDDTCLLIRGTKVRKMHTSRRDAFRPINDLPLARVHKDGKIEILNKNYKKRQDTTVKLDDKFEEKTAFVQVYPGFDPKVLDYYLDNNYKGLLISATALGHVATVEKKYSLIPQLERAKKENIPVVISSQTIYGRTHPYVYTNLRKLSIGENCIFAEDMLPETAFVKLGWVLGHTNDLEEIKKLMTTNIAGEITKHTSPLGYLY